MESRIATLEKQVQDLTLHFNAMAVHVMALSKSPSSPEPQSAGPSPKARTMWNIMIHGKGKEYRFQDFCAYMCGLNAHTCGRGKGENPNILKSEVKKAMDNKYLSPIFTMCVKALGLRTFNDERDAATFDAHITEFFDKFGNAIKRCRSIKAARALFATTTASAQDDAGSEDEEEDDADDVQPLTSFTGFGCLPGSK